MTLFRRRKNPTSTRIVHREEPQKASPQSEETRSAVTSVLSTQRWEPNQGEFRGFDSPPGRF
jgi:hypothetical protein